MAIGYNESKQANSERLQYTERFNKLERDYREAHRFLQKLQGQQNKTTSEKKQVDDWKKEKNDIYEKLANLNSIAVNKIGKENIFKLPSKL